MAFLYRGGPQSPRDEPAQPFGNALSPARNPNRFSGGMMLPTAASDARAGLPRRFTTNALPTLTPIGQQRKQAAGDYSLAAAYARKQPSESAVRRYETLLAAQRELQRELDKVDPETRREVEEGLRHEESVNQMMASSEPTSPPEYVNAFSSNFGRPNRYSTNSLTSPPGLATRPNRSSTQLTSPSGGMVRPYTSGHASTIPSQSVPGSRRQSDDEDDDFIYTYDASVHRAAATPNRNSMPITSYDRKRNADASVLGQVNTTSYLFDEGDESPSASGIQSSTASPPDIKTYLQVQHTADGFPKLIRRGENGDLSSAALDLALAQGVDPQQQVPDRAAAARHRISLPPHALTNNGPIAPLNSILVNADRKAAAANNRRSLEVQFSAETKTQRPALFPSPPRGITNGTMSKATSSYSTNDIPTLKSINTTDNIPGGVPITSPAPSSAIDPVSPEAQAVQQVVSPSISARQSQDFSTQPKIPEESYTHSDAFNQQGAHGAAPSYGGPHDNGMPNFTGAPPANMVSPYAQPANFYGGGYNMNMLSNSFAGMNMNGGYAPAQPQWASPVSSFQQPAAYTGFQQYPPPPPNGQAVAGAQRFQDNNRGATNPQQKRQGHEDALARFNAIDVSDIVGEIYGLCKDQHGCRFLQRKLDERDDNTIQTIFNDVQDNIVELMTDPFGNYLCQKLLEVANDEQRTVLVKNASPAMTKIALNQHGTRALQKMIEYINTPEQTEVIIQSLRYDVVQLIQDLNGNHVIQKCLNHLSSEDATFIFEAVGENCVTVGTHRHGCCVLQRCIDHAAGLQKGALVDRVIANAFSLVQDPFGNYVVQYILDLSEPCFTEPLCQSFQGSVIYMSRQKFSSNVMEKCIRCAGPETKRKLIHEIMAPNELEKLLRDSFANYVVQTAMDFGDEDTKALLVENVRPIMPSIRHTPYGRRIQSKLQEYDNKKSGGAATAVSPPQTMVSPNGNYPYAMQNTPVGRGNRQGFVGPPPQYGSPINGAVNGFGNGGFNPAAFHPGTGVNMGNGGVMGHSSPQTRSDNNNHNLYNSPQGYPGPAYIGAMYNNGGDRAAPYGHF